MADPTFKKLGLTFGAASTASRRAKLKELLISRILLPSDGPLVAHASTLFASRDDVYLHFGVEPLPEDIGDKKLLVAHLSCVRRPKSEPPPAIVELTRSGLTGEAVIAALRTIFSRPMYTIGRAELSMKPWISPVPTVVPAVRVEGAELQHVGSDFRSRGKVLGLNELRWQERWLKDGGVRADVWLSYSMRELLPADPFAAERERCRRYLSSMTTA